MRLDQLGGANQTVGPNHAEQAADLDSSALHRRDCAREIVDAYCSNLPASFAENAKLGSRILAVLEELARTERRPATPPPPRPAVPRHETIGAGYLICLEDGQACA